MNEPLRLLNRTEVEAKFGVSKRFLEMAVMRNDGPPFIKIGRLVRYRAEDIEAWIAQQRVTPNAI
ncbi:MAG: helix-turn-helix domain-containing protein [Paracoccaceae bacterium]|nr:helix-turn-helix domain-containing protein [Paracoccaceae bacterium]